MFCRRMSLPDDEICMHRNRAWDEDVLRGNNIREQLRIEVMKVREMWRQHLSDLVSASLDPVVYAVQWARDPRCVQRGISHRRVGACVESNTRICRLWSQSPRQWE